MLITYYKQPNEPTNQPLPGQFTFTEFYAALQQNTIPAQVAFPTAQKPTFRTFHVNTLTPEFNTRTHSQITQFEHAFNADLNILENTDMTTHYTTFSIPKHSGGMRTINAPTDSLKTLLTNINTCLTNYYILPHNCAYAYISKRCIKDALITHQKTEHKWFMKIDLHDFFGSCNEAFITRQLLEIPFFQLLDPHTFSKLLHACMLNGGLPQGSPLSPWLTNQIMLPIDHKLNKLCHEHNITYTRYADDLLFSANTKNSVKHAKELVTEVLTDTPLIVNETKTKICSIYGQNWNLGLMLNKDNNITVGHKKKEVFRATIYNFCLHYRDWHYQETAELLGKLEYYTSVEPTYFARILTKYGQQYSINIKNTMINILKTHA